jgi:pantothenate kinase-related protein Tda10
MTIADSIAVNTRYTRSVNLERDAASSNVMEAYIPTSRALRTLERVSQVLHEGLEPRAWTLIGPYGSGKSSFALFLAELLGSDDASVRSRALDKIAALDKRLAHNLEQAIGNAAPMLRVLGDGLAFSDVDAAADRPVAQCRGLMARAAR